MISIDPADSIFVPTEKHMLRDNRKRYPVNIHSQHWQLRALTGLASDNVICFPSGHGGYQIQTLNLSTSERFSLRTLDFSPRCLTAGNGWICCGGERGDFVAWQVCAPNASFIESHVTRGVSGPAPRSHRFTTERVNCVTLWFPPKPDALVDLAHGAYNEGVAVLANNDKTVCIVSLEQFAAPGVPRITASIEYPDYVNRAVISPDGMSLAAVLDDAYLYIHNRVFDEAVGSYTWKLCATHMLKSQDPKERSDRRGSFGLSFSPSGVYLAVGTQHGVISVFDVDAFTQSGANPLIRTLNSSRPGTSSGAIRDMAFAPGHLGLLAWSEDRGRIGITDIRSNFEDRQMIDLGESSEFNSQVIDDHTTLDARTLSDAQYNALLSLAFSRPTNADGKVSAPVMDMNDVNSRLEKVAELITNHQEDTFPPAVEYMERFRAIIPEGSQDDPDASRRLFVNHIRDVIRRRQSSRGMAGNRDNTSGLVWNSDGDTLFVGAENGIYELHANMVTRRFAVARSMR